MYICESCFNSTAPKEAIKLFVSKKRSKEYYIAILRHRRNGNKVILNKKPTNEEMFKWKGENFDLISEKVTKGWEIETELKLCNECYNKRQEEIINNNQEIEMKNN